MSKHHRYDRFTRETFEKELPKGFKQVEVAETHELVYERELKDGFAIRVYSSVQVGKEVSRGRGADAIRVLLRHKSTGTAVKRSSKTYRIKDGNGNRRWPENLKEKIKNLEENFRDYIHYCPLCGGLMREVSQNFYGCTNFPKCQYTTGTRDDGRPIPQIVRERTKKAYSFLMEKHDHKSCKMCSKETEAPSNFHNGLFHYILEKGKLTDEQYACIEDKVEVHSR